MSNFQQLAETVSANTEKRTSTRFKLWEKGNIARLYIYDEALYSTKKCKQKAFINLSTYQVTVDTICESQHLRWIENENESAERYLAKWGRYVRFVAYKLGVIQEQKANEQIKKEEQERVNETFPIVKGYYLQWHEVRIPINRYGKLATRNRQHIYIYEGRENLVPYGFVPLTDEQFEIAKKKEGQIIEPYSTPSF